MNHIKWLVDNLANVQKAGFGAIVLRLNVKDGKLDLVEKSVILTDKIKSTIENGNDGNIYNQYSRNS